MTSTTGPTAVPTRLDGPVGTPRREQTRARYPDREGYIERDGVRVFYEVYGAGEQTLLLTPTWSIIHSRFWKAQIPYLARHFRVVTFDGRGTGRSDSPVGAEAYATTEFADDAIAVMDATGVDRAAFICLSCGALWTTIVAAHHPQRVDSVVYIGPAVALAPNHPERDVSPFEDAIEEDDGWAKYNRRYWERDYLGFLEFFFAKCFTEPHSSKQIEDCIDWALETTPQALADATRGMGIRREETFRETCEQVRCPTLVIHGDADEIRPHAQGAALAEATGGQLVTLSGSGHLPLARDPVKINLLIRDFVASVSNGQRQRRP